MKTKIDGYHIDLLDVIAIGPLGGNGNDFDPGVISSRFSFLVWLRYQERPVALRASVGKVDPYNLSSSENDKVLFDARAAYESFVTLWEMAP